MPNELGVGVLGLHEGRTLFVALSHTAPGPIERSQYVPPGSHWPEGKRRAPHARIVAGCDTSADKRADALAVCPGLRVLDSYQAMLALDEVDIVAIYTPDSMHAEHIIAAFDAGKHVICTKPLLNGIGAVRSVREAARRSGKRLLVGQSTRFFEPFDRQRRDFAAGRLGKLELLDAHYVHRMDWFYEKSPWAASDTDWVFLGLSHPLDLACWYLGRIEEVTAYGTRSELGASYGLEGFDIYTVQLRDIEGRIGRAMGHYGLVELPTARNCIELLLYGSKATSQAQYHDMKYRISSEQGDVTSDPLYEKRGWYFNNEVHGMHYGEFAKYTDAFACAILEGRNTSPELDEGLDIVCVMEAARRSAKENRPIAVNAIRHEAGLI